MNKRSIKAGLALCVAYVLVVSCAGVSTALALDFPFSLFGEPSVSYATYVHNKGWQDWKKNGEECVKDDLRMEDLKVKLEHSPASGDVVYHLILEDDTVKTAKNGEGTGAKGKRVEAIQIELTGDLKDERDIWYRVRTKTGWMGWARNGRKAGTTGYGYNILGVEIQFLEKDAKIPGSTHLPYDAKMPSQQAIDDLTGWWASLGGNDGSGYYRTAWRIKKGHVEQYAYGSRAGSWDINSSNVTYLSNNLGAGWYFKDLGMLWPDKDKDSLICCNADGSNYSGSSSMARLKEAPPLK